MSRLDDQSRARECSERKKEAEGLSLEGELHGYSHRIPALRVSASAASSISAHVKRARFAFTGLSLCRGCAPGPAAGRSLARSLALRPRLAAGLPWTIFGVEGPLALERHAIGLPGGPP